MSAVVFHRVSISKRRRTLPTMVPFSLPYGFTTYRERRQTLKRRDSRRRVAARLGGRLGFGEGSAEAGQHFINRLNFVYRKYHPLGTAELRCRTKRSLQSTV
jgi:hypothetical protein